MKRFLRFFSTAVAAGLFTLATADAQTTYTIQEVASPDYTISRALDISDAGAITGVVSDNTILPGYAFIFANGELTLITSAGQGSAARGVNNSGAVIGTIADNLMGFLYSGGGTVLYDDFIPFAINDNGIMVGSQGAEAVINNGGSYTSLGLGFAYDLNNAGQVVYGGPLAANIYFNGSTTTIDGMGGPLSISEVGDVVGCAADASFNVLIYSEGTVYDLGFPGIPEDINNYMQVVGAWEGKAFLYSDGTMTLLDDLIPDDAGWELIRATAINNAGQIVGVGRLNGVERGFVLNPSDPTPTPAQWAAAIAAYNQYATLAENYYYANIETNPNEAIYYYYVYMGIAGQQYYTILGRPDIGDFYYYDGIALGFLWGYDDISAYYGYEAQASYSYYSLTDINQAYYYSYVNLANSWYYGYMDYYEATGDPTYQQLAIESYNYYMALAELYV